MAENTNLSSVELATEMTIAWLGNQNVRVAPDEVPAFLRQIHITIEELSGAAPVASAVEAATDVTDEHVPAVSVRKSLASRDHILSMIDGKPYKTLRRHLASHGLTPEQYRARYRLKRDYPMVAPAYSEHRRRVAKQLGLGQRGRPTKAPGEGTQLPATPPARRGPRKQG